jgi:hypothetical protein
VVLTIASSGPGVGMGFSITSVRPRMVSDTWAPSTDGRSLDTRAERCRVDVSI